MTPASLLGSARRITVKVGSSLLVGQGDDRSQWLKTLAADLSALMDDGKAVVIVSSGAVAMGRDRAGLSKSRRLDAKQAAAAIGQPLLMQAWQSAFADSGKVTAQLLLTIGDTESRRRWRNARSTLDMLHRNGAIPIVNENDSVATEELRYGDNDRLSARVAQMAGGDLLILLSDVDGLYEADPRRDPSAKHCGIVEAIDERLLSTAGDAAGVGPGTGGMRTKLEAARIAQGFGCATLISSGIGDHPLAALSSGTARATIVRAHGSPVSSYKAWIAGSLAPAGKLVVDEGAVSALRQGRSLLPSGCRQLEGDFAQGSSVVVVGPNGAEIARGIVRYGAAEARAILGRKASEIPTILGYSRGDELIHRDDLVLS